MAYIVKDLDGKPIERNGKTVFASDNDGVVKSINKGARTLTIVGTDETRDRGGDIVSIKGWQLENYLKNPVFLWVHDYGSVPIGATKQITRKRNPARLEFTIKFPTEGLFPFADMIYELYGEKIINASSVGFIPLDWENIDDEDEEMKGRYWNPRKFLKQELLELSGCPVPANPSAVQDAIGTKSFGNFKGSDLVNYMNKMSELVNDKTFDGVLAELDKVKAEFKELQGKKLVTVEKNLEDNFETKDLKELVEERMEDENLTDSIERAKEQMQNGSSYLSHEEVFKTVADDKEENKNETTSEKEETEVSEEVTLEDIGEGCSLEEQESDIEIKPFPNEHSCRINQPGKYTKFSRKSCDQKSDGKCIDVIYGRKKDGKSEIQALRYKKDVWKRAAARSHCKGRNGSFEAAEEDSIDEFEVLDAIGEIKNGINDLNINIKNFLEKKNTESNEEATPGQAEANDQKDLTEIIEETVENTVKESKEETTSEQLDELTQTIIDIRSKLKRFKG